MNIIVSISTGILSYGFVQFLDVDHSSLYGLFAFLATFGVYNGQRIFKVSIHADTPWLNWVDKNRVIIGILVLLSLLGALISIMGILNWHLNVILLLISCALISAFYVIRVGKKNLREIPFIKIHLIALSWTLLLIIFPLINEGQNDHLFEVGLAHYAYVLAVTIPFDIRDLKYDLIEQNTIPQIMGVKASKGLAIVLLIVSGILLLSVFPPLMNSVLFYVAIASQIVLVLLMKESRSDLYCAGWIDGAIALLGLAYLFA